MTAQRPGTFPSLPPFEHLHEYPRHKKKLHRNLSAFTVSIISFFSLFLSGPIMVKRYFLYQKDDISTFDASKLVKRILHDISRQLTKFHDKMLSELKPMSSPPSLSPLVASTKNSARCNNYRQNIFRLFSIAEISGELKNLNRTFNQNGRKFNYTFKRSRKRESPPSLGSISFIEQVSRPSSTIHNNKTNKTNYSTSRCKIGLRQFRHEVKMSSKCLPQ